MDIKRTIIETCDWYRVTPTELARMAGVDPTCLTKLVAGSRPGIAPATVGKLTPFIDRVVDRDRIRGK